ncbi:MAG: Uncharacterized protein K0S02_1629 [Achromobacter mucicolens]|jgi:hypothetical protein|uniref:portal protein n=1 Tax=Achromobacter mucicolens TaxID=1389922 RepID=UPI00243143C8|nr:hypothetical protein [Achromobacter mucicolens]MDF2861357.1 Uncharacterized protein [Achromobacter mucicolens]
MNTSVTGFRLLDGSDGATAHARDQAPAEPGALSVSQLERWLDEIRDQPSWRREADKACDYYDGNQLDAETLARLDEKGLGPLVTNLIQPTVNAVLGMEAKTRTDWRVGADDDRYQDVAEALSAKMHETEREAQADTATSDAYASQIKAGFGVVEVSRNSNPFNYPYRVTSVPRSEIYWDWRSRALDWSDARYVVRKKRYDADHIAAFFPEHREMILAASNWRDWTDHLTNEARMSADFFNSLGQGTRTTWDDLDWRDVERRVVTCFEVWYRVWVRGLVLALPGGRTLEFNEQNQVHRALVASGAVQPKLAVYDKIRCAFHIGPIRVLDRGSNRRRFPYVPFFGYREDLTGVPYGIIRAMLSPQDEVNARAARMMWLLNSRRTFIDSDALDEKYNTMSDANRELGRADAFIVTNPRAAKGNIKVESNFELSQQQFQIMQERKQAIQEAAGVYAAMMGQQSNASSGLAIQSLVEQGVTTLAKINDNYRVARRGVGNALLDLIKEDMTSQAEILVDNGTVKRKVVVNIPRKDPVTGEPYKENDVQTAPVKVALSDVPSTPTYRAQQFAAFSEILKSMPPNMQALLIPFALEMSDFGKRKEMAAFLRAQLGIQADPNSPEAQAAKKQADEAANAQAQAAMQDAQSKIAERQARAEKLLAEAERIRREAGAAGDADTVGQVDGALARYESEMQALRQQLADRTSEWQTRLQQTAMHEEAETERARIRAEAQTGGAQMQERFQQLTDEVDQVLERLGTRQPRAA